MKYDSNWQVDSGTSLQTVYDKLWYFSPNEMGEKVGTANDNHTAEGVCYDKMIGTGDVSQPNPLRNGYVLRDGNTSGTTLDWWMRSIKLHKNDHATICGRPGCYTDEIDTYDRSCIAPGFVLKR